MNAEKLLKRIEKLEDENMRLRKQRHSIMEDEDVKDLTVLTLMGTATKLFRPSS